MKNFPTTTLVSLSLLGISAASSFHHGGISSVSGLICGSTGFDNGYSSFLSTGYSNSWAYCQSVRGLHAECKSFSYYIGERGYTGGDCKLFDVYAGQNFIYDTGSPYKFYDVGCAAQEKMCNMVGISRTDAWLGFSVGSMSECSMRCSDYNDRSTNCVSYAFASDGTCLLYSYLIADNVDVDSASNFTFNDALCDQNSTTTTKDPQSTDTDTLPTATASSDPDTTTSTDKPDDTSSDNNDADSTTTTYSSGPAQTESSAPAATHGIDGTDGSTVDTD